MYAEKKREKQLRNNSVALDRVLVPPQGILQGTKDPTADGDCSHEIKWCLLLGRKAMTNLDSILKSKDIILPTKVRLVKAMVFPVVMHGCERWAIKTAEHWRSDVFNCSIGEDSWGTLGLQRDQTSQSERNSILNIHWKDWCWSWSSNPLASWCKEVIHYTKRWCWGRLKAGGEGDDIGQDDWMASLIQWTWVWASYRRWWRTRKPGLLKSMGSQRVRHDWATERQQKAPPK